MTTAGQETADNTGLVWQYRRWPYPATESGEDSMSLAKSEQPRPHQPGGSRPALLIRSRSHQVFFLLVAAACLAMVVGFLVVGMGKEDPVPQAVAAVIFFALAGAAIRWSLASVVFDYTREAMIVHNPLRTHTIAFSDIYGFESVASWISGGNGNIRLLVKVTRKNRKRTTLVGACAFGGVSVAKMIAQLNGAT